MIEERFKEAIDRWVADACPMGGFMTAVLENDLAMAMGKADEGARENLFDIIKYLWNECPAHCWGSKEIEGLAAVAVTQAKAVLEEANK
jgi:hypothetical protein